MLLIGAAPVLAQNTDNQARTGSIYSKLGLGFPVDLSSSAADGMGLSGVSFVEPFVPGLANPAQWGSTVYGMATGGISLRGLDARDNQATSTNLLFSPNYFQLQLPAIRSKLGFSASVSSLTNHAFGFSESNVRILDNGGTPDTLRYETVNNGDGGVTMLEVGAGWQINEHLSVGYAPSLLFVSLDNDYTTSFEDPDLRTVSYTRTLSGLGFGNRFGILVNLLNVFRNDDQVSIGTSLMLPVSIDAEKTQETDRQLPNGSIETIVTSEGDDLGSGTIDYPMMLNGGITYQPSRILSFSAEGLYQQWSEYTNSYSSANPQQLTDRYKLGMGFRYFPYITGSQRFFSNFKYRFGASYDAGHLKLNGNRIETLKFSFGLGILSPRSNSSVDINFEYGFRGTTDQNLVREDIWGIQLSVNLAELMFFRPRLQ